MLNLQTVIEKAASGFAKLIIDAVKQSSLQELLALQGGAAPVAEGAKRRGRPPKAKPGRKPGRPPKTVARQPAKKVAKKSAKKTAKAPAKKKRKINYPKCSVPGCGKNRWARGNGMCGEHFKASKAS